MIDQLTILFAIVGAIGLLFMGFAYLKGWFKKEEQTQD